MLPIVEKPHDALPLLRRRMFSVAPCTLQGFAAVDNVVYSDVSDGLNAVVDMSVSTKTCVPEGAQVQLEGSASTVERPVTVDRYLWDFGDGSTSEGATAKHVYDRCGRYQATLTVTAGEFSRTASRLICVSGPPSNPDSVAPWTAVDVGDPGFPGRSETLGDDDGGCLAICAGGVFLAGPHDQFHFVYQELEGDLSLSARVSHAGAAQAGGQVGVMLRESLDPRARHGAMVLSNNATRARFVSVRRHVERRSSRTFLGADAPAADVWVRIERRGDELISSSSTDGATWTEVHRFTFEAPLPAKLFGGIVAIGNDPEPNLGFEPLDVTVCDVRVEFPRAPPRFLRADANDDTRADLADAVHMLNHLFVGGAELACVDAADANDDGAADLSDPVYLLGFLFLGGPPPAAPFDACGEDPTPDGLACAESSAVCR